MESPNENSIKIVEVTKISPSKSSANHYNLIHLTCFDMMWIKFHPVERLFFYELNSSYSSDFILHSLKHSLSLALSYYLPLASQLTWGPHDPKPYILCSPTDSVSLVVAETINADDDDDNNFHKLCSKGNLVKATALRRYAPSLQISDEAAAIMSLQITFFPGFGFCIGIAAHHGVLDAKSTIMFMKSWAYLCQKLVLNQQTDPLLPANLCPHLDRTVIKDPTGKLDMFHLNNSLKLAARINPGGNPRSLRVPGTESAPDQVRATFDLSPQDINTIREIILSKINPNDDDGDNDLHLSSFTVTYAHAIVCFVKAKAVENNVKINFLFPADFRSRLIPPLPANYFGNCVGPDKMITLESKDIIGEEGLMIVARNISESLRNLAKYGYFERVQEVSDSLSNCERGPLRPISPAGSHKLEVYGVDFGWGIPRKVDIVSIDQANSFSMAESRDKSGGIEIGLVMKNQVELQAFASLFP